MAYWLLKTEPTEFSWERLERERRTRWDGVENPVAKKHLDAMRPGDWAVVYHTGREKRAMGIAEVIAAGDPPTLEPRQALAAPVTLEQIKASAAFKASPLVKIGRLSVVPLSDKEWKALLALAKTRI